ncbi:MAG: chorismate synthase [Clostridia bacterium]|nr:chorismate synthase [Clostridia bacterium]
MLRRLQLLTAGESHGPMLVGILEGIPAGLPLSAQRDIDPYLARRQGGFGRGGRQRIERDRARIVAGVRLGETLGSPIAVLLENRDFRNWRGVMDPEADLVDPERTRLRRVTTPRPGHADLAGGLKYDRADLRDVLERASARDTAMRVALGAVALRLLRALGVRVLGHVVAIGPVAVRDEALSDLGLDELARRASRSPVYCADGAASALMVEAVREAMRRHDTLGGVVEVRARGLPVGLGSHVDPARRLDARLAAALMAVQAVKGVEIGLGFRGSAMSGRDVHDPIAYEPGPATRRAGGYRRSRNGAGGLEGGTTNGEELVLRVAMKPLSTLTEPLPSVDVETKEPARAAVERTDATAVPALSVVAEAVVGTVLADAVLEKFGGDSLRELKRNLAGYLRQIARHPQPARPAARSGRAPLAPRAAGGRPNLVLVGPPGSGKSTVAEIVARRARAPLYDTDALVRAHAGRPIARIFTEEGEARFRALESQVIGSLPKAQGAVVTTGGGAVLDPANRKTLREGGFVVRLLASPQEILRRLAQREVPMPLRAAAEALSAQAGLAPEEGLHRAVVGLLRAREAAYAEAADASVATDGRSEEEVAEEILRLWEAWAPPQPVGRAPSPTPPEASAPAARWAGD